MSIIIELAVELVGGLIFDTIESSLTSFSPRSRVEKIHEKLIPFQGKTVTIRTGTVLTGGKFQINEEYSVSSFKMERKENNLLFSLKDNEPLVSVDGKTLSRFYTGKRGANRICINTENTDYLIDLVNIN